MNLSRKFMRQVQKIKEIVEKRLKASYIRARMREIREETGSKEWYERMEKKRGMKKCMSSLIASNGNEITEKDDVVNEAQKFYEFLFSKLDTVKSSQDRLLEKVEGKLSFEQRKECEGFISEGEAYAALSQMHNDKTPGIDGLPKEFYQENWETVGLDLVDVLNAVFFEGEMSRSMRRAVIILLFKKGDPRLLKNWRPISLLTCDYKIVSKVMANRLKVVIPNLIGMAQTCGVKNGNMYDNLQLMRMMQEYALKTDPFVNNNLRIKLKKEFIPVLKKIFEPAISLPHSCYKVVLHFGNDKEVIISSKCNS